MSVFDDLTLHVVLVVLHFFLRPIPASQIAPPPPSSFDLLGSIFKEQSILHMNSADIVIERDGKYPVLQFL